MMFRTGDGDDFEALRAILGAVIAQASTGARAAGEIKTVLRMVGPRSFGRLVDAERDSIAWPFIVAEYRTRCGCFSDDWRCELSSPGRFCVSAPMLNGLAFVQWVEIGGAEARAS